MDYIKYQKVKKIGSQDTEGLLEGTCYVFPKLDGANAHIWWEDGEMKTGSRNRKLGGVNGLQGFKGHVENDSRYTALCMLNPDYHFYGEWLIPHALNTYEPTAWKKFYIFDAVNKNTGAHLNFNSLNMMCGLSDLTCIQPIAELDNPTADDILKLARECSYLVVSGIGEGVVVKNYNYVNKFGHQVWGKVVVDEFLESKGQKKQKVGLVGRIEGSIVEKYVTLALVDKNKAKIEVANEGWRDNCIGELIGRVWYDLVDEHIVDAISDLKNPIINFKVLRGMTTLKIKELKRELF